MDQSDYEDEESKEVQTIAQDDDEYDIQLVADNINGIGIGSYMSKYLSQKLEWRQGYAMLSLNINTEQYDRSNGDMLKQTFFDKNCILVDSMEDLLFRGKTKPQMLFIHRELRRQEDRKKLGKLSNGQFLDIMKYVL